MYIAQTSDILASICQDLDTAPVSAEDWFGSLIFHQEGGELGFDFDED